MNEEFQDSSAERRYGPIGSSGNARSTLDQPRAPGGADSDVSDALPVYSTLPANAGNFSQGQLGKIAASSATNGIIFTYVVPAGFVLYADSFQVNVEDTFSAGSNPNNSLGVPPLPLSITLFNNGGAKPFTQNIIIEPFDGPYPCTVIANAGEVVTIGVTYDYSGQPTPPGNVIFISHLFGQLLQQNKLQTQYTALKKVILSMKGVA